MGVGVGAGAGRTLRTVPTRVTRASAAPRKAASVTHRLARGSAMRFWVCADMVLRRAGGSGEGSAPTRGPDASRGQRGACGVESGQLERVNPLPHMPPEREVRAALLIHGESDNGAEGVPRELLRVGGEDCKGRLARHNGADLLCPGRAWARLLMLADLFLFPNSLGVRGFEIWPSNRVPWSALRVLDCILQQQA